MITKQLYNKTKTMKKFNWLMMLLTAATLSFAACTEPQIEDPGPGPEPEQPKGPFAVEITEITYSSVAYTVTPSDLEAEYLCLLYDAESVEEFTQDKYLVATLYQELEAEARAMGMTLAEFLPTYTDKGILEDQFVGLATESDYYLIVFGVDPANNYEACTELNKTKFTTEAFEKLNVTFDIQTTVDGNSAEYVVTPSDNETIWYFYTIPTGTFDYYQSPDAYGMSLEQFYLYCLQMQIDGYRGAGYDDNTILNALFHKGQLTLQAKDLTANASYTNMVAGFVIDDSGVITLATDVTTSTYTTGDAKAVELSFQISVTDVETNRAAIKITPSDNSKTFCWMVMEWDGVATAEEVMNDIVAMYGGWMNSGMMLYSGVQDYTGGPGSAYKYRLDAPDTDYLVIAFGYAGGITTEAKMVTFRTLPAPGAEETEFTMTATNANPYGFTLGVTPTEASTYYIFDVIEPSEWDETAAVEAINAGIAEILEMQQMYDPNVTLSQVLSMYYYRGAYNVTVSGMTPETTVMGYICAIDHKTGTVARTHVFNPLATTTKVGDITPSIELVGNYSGKEENGTIFGDAEYTAQKAITVVKYTNFDGARSLFASMMGDNNMNFTDSELFGQAYWSSVSTSQPYSFYLVDWDYEQTALAYAVDANGLAGGVGRMLTCATAENKNNIEELRALVNELNSASKSSFSMPASIVVNEGIQLNVISSEVELPVAEAKAEVKAAPAVVETNAVKVGGYIRPFYM